jgi:hypothetical protein
MGSMCAQKTGHVSHRTPAGGHGRNATVIIIAGRDQRKVIARLEQALAAQLAARG